MSSKRFKSKLQRQAQTRPLENATDSESLSQYSLASTPSTQTPRAVETVIHETCGGPEQRPVQEANLDAKSERFAGVFKSCAKFFY